MPPQDKILKVTTNNKKGSVAIAKVKTVSFKELWGNYPTNKIEHLDPSTHKDVINNHCAVYLSHCLFTSGITLNSFKGTRCWYCPTGKSVHAIVAEELANWLQLKPFPGCPDPIKCTGKDFKTILKDKKGIIFFKDYWQRENEKGTKNRTGDHIDLWDDGILAGQAWILSIIRIRFGQSIDGWMSDYGLSKEVLFWEIK